MDSRHIVNLRGKDFPTYPGVLAEAHERGLEMLATELIQIPSEENGHTAIVKAKVMLKGGGVFEDYGDASPRNTSATIATALIRMASTRAKGRALRDACNVGQTMLEELPDLEEARGQEPPRIQRSEPAAESGAAGPLVCGVEGCGVVLNQAQHTLSVNKFGKSLCPAHQRAAQITAAG